MKMSGEAEATKATKKIINVLNSLGNIELILVFNAESFANLGIQTSLLNTLDDSALSALVKSKFLEMEKTSKPTAQTPSKLLQTNYKSLSRFGKPTGTAAAGKKNNCGRKLIAKNIFEADDAPYDDATLLKKVEIPGRLLVAVNNVKEYDLKKGDGTCMLMSLRILAQSNYAKDEESADHKIKYAEYDANKCLTGVKDTFGVVTTFLDQYGERIEQCFFSYGAVEDANATHVHDPSLIKVLGQYLKLGAPKSFCDKILSGAEIDLTGDTPTFVYFHPGLDKGESVSKYLNQFVTKFNVLTSKSKDFVEIFGTDYDYSTLIYPESEEMARQSRTALKELMKRLDRYGDDHLMKQQGRYFMELQKNKKSNPKLENHFTKMKQTQMSRISSYPLKRISLVVEKKKE